MVTGFATGEQEQCPWSPMGSLEGRQGREKGSTGAGGAVPKTRQMPPPPPAPGQPGLMLWRPAPIAKVPTTAGGPAHSSAQGKSPAMRLREERGGHKQREDRKGCSVFHHHSELLWVGYKQDEELRVAGGTISQSNQGAQGLPLVYPKPQKDSFRFRIHQLQQISEDGCGAGTWLRREQGCL